MQEEWALLPAALYINLILSAILHWYCICTAALVLQCLVDSLVVQLLQQGQHSTVLIQPATRWLCAVEEGEFVNNTHTTKIGEHAGLFTLHHKHKTVAYSPYSCFHGCSVHPCCCCPLITLFHTWLEKVLRCSSWLCCLFTLFICCCRLRLFIAFL